VRNAVNIQPGREYCNIDAAEKNARPLEDGKKGVQFFFFLLENDDGEQYINTACSFS